MILKSGSELAKRRFSLFKKLKKTPIQNECLLKDVGKCISPQEKLKLTVSIRNFYRLNGVTKMPKVHVYFSRIIKDSIDVRYIFADADERNHFESLRADILAPSAPTEYLRLRSTNFSKVFFEGWKIIFANKTNICISVPPNIDNPNKRSGFQVYSNENGPAVITKQGKKFYYLNDKQIPSKVFENPTKVTFKEIAAISNIETRGFVLRKIGIEQVLKLVEAIEVDKFTDKYDNLNILYKSKDTIGKLIRKQNPKAQRMTNDTQLFFLKVICPSTKKEHVLYVPKHVSARAAKAWTFNMKMEDEFVKET